MISEKVITYDKDDSVTIIDRNGVVINEIRMSEVGVGLKKRHTEIEIFNCDFPLNDGQDDLETPIGKVVILPCFIDSICSHTNKPGMVLINLNHGASYWIKESTFMSLIDNQEQ